MPYRILHLADLHLEASFATSGLSRSAGAWRRADLRATLGRLLSLARERHVDAVTIAGDLYEEKFAPLDTIELLAQQFSKLAPIRVFIAPGERDAYYHDSLYALARWPENVTVFSKGCLEEATLAPQLHLWGAACPPLPGVTLKPQPRPEGTNLLLLHAAPAGVETSHEGIFTLAADTLGQSGWDYALLGHVHSAHFPCDKAIYPGSPEPLSPEESKQAHCVALVTVEDQGCHAELLPVAQWRYVALDVDMTGCCSDEEAIRHVQQALRRNQFPDDRRTTCYLTLTGSPTCALDWRKLRDAVRSDAHLVWRLAFPSPYALESLQQEQTVRGLLVRRFSSRVETVGDEERRKQRMILELALQALDGKQVQDDEIA